MGLINYDNYFFYAEEKQSKPYILKYEIFAQKIYIKGDKITKKMPEFDFLTNKTNKKIFNKFIHPEKNIKSVANDISIIYKKNKKIIEKNKEYLKKDDKNIFDLDKSNKNLINFITNYNENNRKNMIIDLDYYKYLNARKDSKEDEIYDYIQNNIVKNTDNNNDDYLFKIYKKGRKNKQKIHRTRTQLQIPTKIGGNKDNNFTNLLKECITLGKDDIIKLPYNEIQEDKFREFYEKKNILMKLLQ